MDTWSEKQFKKMQLGGNANCISFFKKHGIDMNQPIRVKYTGKVAEAYRSKMEALVEGKQWTEPNLAKQSSSSPNASSSRSETPKSSHKTSQQSSDWDDWDSSKSSSAPSSASRSNGNRPSSSRESKSSSSDSFDDDEDRGEERTKSSRSQNGSKSRLSSSDSSATGNRRSENLSDDRYSRFSGQQSISSADFFNENPRDDNDKSRKTSSDGYSSHQSSFASRGSNGASGTDDVFKVLEEGWSKFSVVAKNAAQAGLEGAKVAAEKVKQTTNELSVKVQEKGWSDDVSQLGSKLASTSEKGWNLMQGYWSKAKESVNQYTSEWNNDPNNPQQQYQPQNNDSGFNSYQPNLGSDFIQFENNTPAKKNEEPTPDFEDWINEENSKPRTSSKQKQQSNNKNEGWDDWDDSPSIDDSAQSSKSKKSSKKQPNLMDDEYEVVDSSSSSSISNSKPSSNNNKKNEESFDGWDNWDNDSAATSTSTSTSSVSAKVKSKTSPSNGKPAATKGNNEKPPEGWEGWDNDW